jgi:hypothetical protein
MLREAGRRIFVLRGETSSREALALLRELETSFERSQRALLSGDADALQLQTTEQTRLLAELDALAQAAADEVATNASENRDAAGSSRAELRAVAGRVLHLGRVQAVLLARAGQRIRMIAGLLAGPQAAYAAAAEERSAVICAHRGGRTRCRA